MNLKNLRREEILLLGCCAACAPDAGSTRPPDGVLAAAPWFVDRTRELGLDFVCTSGASGKLYLTEVMGAGLGLFDADGDGDLELLLRNGSLDPVTGKPAGPHTSRLYENRLSAGGGLVDVTEASALVDASYGMGLAVGDIDNDGDRDVALTNLGSVRLFENQGGGRFRDISTAAGIAVEGWSCSAAFLDYDRDGFLDLYVTRYVAFDPAVRCRVNDGRVDYCSPSAFPFVADVLLHNETGQAGRRFADVSAAAGIAAVRAPGLGVVCADFDADGWIDVFVANDGQANQLWRNQGDGTFRDRALQWGVALNLSGRAEAGMGVVVGDFDANGHPDLFLTHLSGESNTLYLNRGGSAGFADATGRSGMAAASLPWTGFGVAAFDAELDGDLDLLVVNGRVTRAEARAGSLAPPPWDLLAEPKSLYLNDGQARFRPAPELLGDLAQAIEVSRGLALGDLDGDGDLDLAVNSLESAARVYRNEVPRQGRWLLVRALDPRLRRDALGARVSVEAGGKRFLRWIEASSSYLSSSEPRAHFGLGAVDAVVAIEVIWPDGLRESFPGTCVDCAVELVRGTGRELP